MDGMELVCAVYGEATVFPVTIARDATVSALQEAIATRYKLMSNRVAVYPSRLTLYVAREGNTFLKDDDNMDGVLTQRTPGATYTKMRPTWRLTKPELFGLDFKPAGDEENEEIHVLVQLPDDANGVASAIQRHKPREINLKPVSHDDMQSKMWKSIVKVSSVDGVSCGTALVVDRTATHVYVLTNLELWIDERFADHVSDEFATEIQRYLKVHPGLKPTSGTTRKRKSGGTTEPMIVMEQLLERGKTMHVVLRFPLESSVCWYSSATFGYAILQVALEAEGNRQHLQLASCRMIIHVGPPMQFYVCGFPCVYHDRQSDQSRVSTFAILPVQATGWYQNQLTLASLSDHGVPKSGVLCVGNGVVAGFIGGGAYGSTNKQETTSYAFTLHGIEAHLPSRWPAQ